MLSEEHICSVEKQAGRTQTAALESHRCFLIPSKFQHALYFVVWLSSSHSFHYVVSGDQKMGPQGYPEVETSLYV